MAIYLEVVVAFNLAMDNEAEFRRACLHRLIKRLGRGAIAHLANKLGKSPSYVSRLLSDPASNQHRSISGDVVLAINALYPDWLSYRPYIDGEVVERHVANEPKLIALQTASDKKTARQNRIERLMALVEQIDDGGLENLIGRAELLAEEQPLLRKNAL